ncbi:MAG: cytochrome c assembly protein [Bacteroidetes bacterium]|nr:cytochrome c assembly protein [Bacteroidota bacterium]
MKYIGENLLPGQLGHFFILLSLVSAGLSTISYFFAAQQPESNESKDWKKLGRISFIIQALSVTAIFSLLFFIIQNHLFEYHYAWKHSSRSLEFKYLLACFWEGQEGSFLLWNLCQAILGLVLIRKAGSWESPVMTTVSFAQFALSTMVMGLYIAGWKMGSNPFILLRDSGVLDNAPALHVNFDISQPLLPDYLSSIKDGNDLNPLLQNYWMVIHPPVLFMGFASTLIPFAYAIAGLWTKKHDHWTTPALPWSLFSTAVLGVGIMMGGMWAYESLSFGGYWAWDPVENASLVPWMTGVAGLHTLLICRATSHSLRATYLFFILTFLFILYSTFLTRSGILGETSVHAFTDLGMNWQLLAFLLIFAIPSLFFFFRSFNKIPTVPQEEEINSREFWMFIGALVIFLSALVIIGQTSLPVFNKIFGTTIAPPADVEFSYNSIQLYVALILAVLTAVSHYLKYKSTSRTFFWKKMLIPALISAIAGALFLIFGEVNYQKKGVVFHYSITLTILFSFYTIITNASYIWVGIKGNINKAGGSIAHVGFGMVLTGILLSSANKEIISTNVNGIPAPLGEGENPQENLTLVQGLPVTMGNYTLTYLKDSAHPKKPLWFYKIQFKNQKEKEDFILTPNAFVNYKGNQGLMANPDARHYWDHDVFTYITSLPDPENQKDTATFKSYLQQQGDTLFYSNGFMIFDSIQTRDNLPKELFGEEGKLFEVPIRVKSKTGTSYLVTGRAAFVKGQWISLSDTLVSEGLILQLQEANPKGTVRLGIKESDALLKYVTLKAYRYPFVKVLWYGVWLTAIGLLLSMINRIRKNRTANMIS